MAKPRTLILLDTDERANVFDSITAIDSGIEFLLTQAGVNSKNLSDIVHGAIFTRGGDDLRSTALFVGGSRVTDGEQVLEQIKSTFFGPCRVSVMLDSNGANTTAAAAVLSAARHLNLHDTRASVLAGTGPVGRRTAELLIRSGASVTLTSRSLESAEATCQSLRENLKIEPDRLQAVALAGPDALERAIGRSRAVFSCGAAGVTLWPKTHWNRFEEVKVAIDLNAVPPSGIEVISVSDKAKELDGVVVYGAIGVGGLKMKIHRKCVAQLFEANDQILDAAEIFEIGKSLVQKS